MTDLEYIVKQAKKFYYVQWDEAELRKCVDMLPKLEHDELVRLFNCKWTKKVLKEAIFNCQRLSLLMILKKGAKGMSH